MLLSFGSIIYSLGPSMKIFSLDLIFPIVPPICWALYQFFTKVVSSDNEPFASIFYTSILGAIIFSIFISFNWVPLEKNIYWLYLVLLGAAGFVSHSLIIYAIQLSNLSFVTNFQYSQLIWSTIVNFLIFGVPFDYNKIIGVIGIIIFGLLFIRTEGGRCSSRSTGSTTAVASPNSSTSPRSGWARWNSWSPARRRGCSSVTARRAPTGGPRPARSSTTTPTSPMADDRPVTGAAG